MKLLLWNVEWAPSHRVRVFVLRTLAAEMSDVICLTESTDFFLAEYPNAIASGSDYGYPNPGDRRKLWLISNEEWTNVDTATASGLPPGRFVSGITHGIRFVGICIPWFDAHVSTGQRNRRRWEDHLVFLHNLKPILADYAAQDVPVCVLGDFNQRIPPTAQNTDYLDSLHAALSGFYTIHTSNELDVDGYQLIDHVATTESIHFKVDQTIGRLADGGRHLSDHPAIIGTISGEP